MKYHCEGTTPHASLTLADSTPAARTQAGNSLFTIGNVGYIKLAMDARAKRNYGMLAYDNLLKVLFLFKATLL